MNFKIVLAGVLILIGFVYLVLEVVGVEPLRV